MSRRNRRDDGEDVDVEEEVDEEEVEVGGGRGSSRGGGGGKRSRVESFVDDAASEEEEDDDEDDDDYGPCRARARKRNRSILIDDMAQVDDDDEEEEDGEYEDGFIDDDARADIHDKDAGMSSAISPNHMHEDLDNVDQLEEMIRKRYGPSHSNYVEEELTKVEQQALLPSVKDPKLWMVKCAIGHERSAAVCLMQKFIDTPDLQIKSVVALDDLKNYIYVEAQKEAHVKEACKGLRNIFTSAKIIQVPMKEMTAILSAQRKSVDLSRDTWVRMKRTIYNGDLAKIVDVDDVRQKVTVKLIPRIDLHALTNKLNGLEVVKKKSFVPPPRFFSVDEAREMNIHVDRRRIRDTGEFVDIVDGLMFKDGFLHKTVSIKSISTKGIRPSIDELEKFRRVGDDMNDDVASLSTLLTNRRKGHFMKGDAVVVVKGDLKNLEGCVEKVEDDTVHIRPKLAGLPKTLAFNEKDLCKFFKPGDHVKVVSGVQEGATGMVVKVEGHVLIILSDTSNEHIRVFADHVVDSSEVTTGITRIGDYELHDLVLFGNFSFGVIVKVESEAFQVLNGVPDKPELMLVKLREMKCKICRRTSAKDRYDNTVSTKDIVRVVEGASKGKQGPVEHIHKGLLFIYDRHHLEHSGFICAKAQSCVLVGGLIANTHEKGMDTADPRHGAFRSPARILQSPGRLPPRGPYMNSGGGGRGGRGHDSLLSRCIKIKSGPYKGYRGRVKEVNGALVRVELESVMKIVRVKREDIGDTSNVATPARETPMHPSRTPLRPIQTPMQDPGATPIHDEIQTPLRSNAWTPTIPLRDKYENPGTWGTWGNSPTYQPATPQVRPYEAPTPGSGWACTPGVGFADTSVKGNSPTPIAEPMTPSAFSYLPGTPGGQPMAPGNVDMDIMSPVLGGEGDSSWLLPDVVVKVSRGGDGDVDGVVKEVLPDGSCRVTLGSSGGGYQVTASPDELEVVRPKRYENLKIMNGAMRGMTGKLMGIDGSDGLVKVDDGNNDEVKILDMMILGKLAI